MCVSTKGSRKGGPQQQSRKTTRNQKRKNNNHTTINRRAILAITHQQPCVHTRGRELKHLNHTKQLQHEPSNSSKISK